MAKDEQRQQRKSVVTLEPMNSHVPCSSSYCLNSYQVRLEQNEKLQTQVRNNID